MIVLCIVLCIINTGRERRGGTDRHLGRHHMRGFHTSHASSRDVDGAPDARADADRRAARETLQTNRTLDTVQQTTLGDSGSDAERGARLTVLVEQVGKITKPGRINSERINSEFAFVKDRRRNRLGHEKAKKLVGLFHNLRLLARMKKLSYVEPAVGWNDDDTQSSITKFGIANFALKNV